MYQTKEKKRVILQINECNKEYWECIISIFTLYITSVINRFLFEFLGSVNIYVYKEIKNLNTIFGVLHTLIKLFCVFNANFAIHYDYISVSSNRGVLGVYDCSIILSFYLKKKQQNFEFWCFIDNLLFWWYYKNPTICILFDCVSSVVLYSIIQIQGPVSKA